MRTGSGFYRWWAGNWRGVVLAAAALVIRLVYLLTVIDDPFFGYLKHIPDAYYYNNWALHIVANNDWLGGKDPYFIGPLYAYFLAGIYSLVGPRLLIVRIIQILLDSGTVVCLYGLGRRVFGERPAIVAGLIWSLYLPAIFFTAFILPVSFDLFLIALSFYLLARGGNERVLPWVGAGAALGGALLDRSNLLLFAALAVPVFIIFIKRKRWSRVVAYFLPIAVLVGATTLRNYVVARDWVVVSSQGGVNFFIGNSASARGTYWNLGEVGQGRPDELNRDLATFIAEDAVGRKMKPSEVSRWWTGQAWEWLRAHPGDAARLYGRKVRFLLNDYEVGLNVDFYFMKFLTPFHKIQFPWFGLVFPLGVVGLTRGWRGSPFVRKLLAVFIGGYAVSVLLFFISSRYRIPLALGLVPFAGAGGVAIYDAWRGWRLRAALPLTALAMGVAFFAAYPVRGYSRDVAFGQTYYRYGKFFYDEGQYDRALPYLYKAVNLTPDFYPAYYILGATYDQLGQKDTAVDIFWRGVCVAPQVPELHFGYGLSLVKIGRLREAVGPFTRAVELDPTYVPAWNYLAEVRYALYDYDGAAAAFSRVVQLNPRDAAARVKYAEILLTTGNVAASLEQATAALQIDPRAVGANVLIGSWYYNNGDYASALPYFQKEVSLDYSSARGYGFLAATYLRLGDKEEARRAYERYRGLGGPPDPAFERDAAVRPGE